MHDLCSHPNHTNFCQSLDKPFPIKRVFFFYISGEAYFTPGSLVHFPTTNLEDVYFFSSRNKRFSSKKNHNYESFAKTSYLFTVSQVGLWCRSRPLIQNQTTFIRLAISVEERTLNTLVCEILCPRIAFAPIETFACLLRQIHRTILITYLSAWENCLGN